MRSGACGLAALLLTGTLALLSSTAWSSKISATGTRDLAGMLGRHLRSRREPSHLQLEEQERNKQALYAPPPGPMTHDHESWAL